LTEPALSTTATRRLERQKAYYDRLAATPVEERDRRLRQRFDEIDTNHDGKLDEEEVASHVNHLHSN
jgi:EF-hand domain